MINSRQQSEMVYISIFIRQHTRSLIRSSEGVSESERASGRTCIYRNT